MSPTLSPHDRFTHALERVRPLPEPARMAIAQLPIEVNELSPSAFLIREGQLPRRCVFLMDGFTYRQKLTVEGQRAIVAIQVPDDFVDVQNLFLPESDHDVQALTTIRFAEIQIPDMRALVRAHPAVGDALWFSSLREASITREWLLNISRRDARARTAHLLCEMSTRLQVIGGGNVPVYDLPMTQEQLGDALGLTSVHINRVLKGLEESGLIARRKRTVTIVDWDRVCRVGDFNERYLHMQPLV